MGEIHSYAFTCSKGELIGDLGLSSIELVQGHSSADGTHAARSLLGQAFVGALAFLGVTPVLPPPNLAHLSPEALPSFPFPAEAHKL